MIFLNKMGTKVHSNPLPEYNLPVTEMFFSEAPVGSHCICKYNIYIIVREVVEKIVFKNKSGKKNV